MLPSLQHDCSGDASTPRDPRSCKARGGQWVPRPSTEPCTEDRAWEASRPVARARSDHDLEAGRGGEAGASPLWCSPGEDVLCSQAACPSLGRISCTLATPASSGPRSRGQDHAVPAPGDRGGSTGAGGAQGREREYCSWLFRKPRVVGRYRRARCWQLRACGASKKLQPGDCSTSRVLKNERRPGSVAKIWPGLLPASAALTRFGLVSASDKE